jgi:hypothetical protein
MTEQPTTYATPAKDDLTFRLVTPGGLSIGVSFPPSPEADDLSAATRELVLRAFEQANGGAIFPASAYPDHHAEVLAQCTLDRIADLERILQDCCNAMIDATEDAKDLSHSHWDDLISQAHEILP